MLIFYYKVGNNMKRIIKVFLAILVVSFMTGCKKDYNAITYTKFVETFRDRQGFLVNNQSLKYEETFERCFEAASDNVQFLYFEFKDDNAAKEYITKNYANRKKYKFHNKGNYITVKCTNGMYFYAIQIDKTIIIGDSQVKKNRKEIKKIFKELGY